MCILIVKPRGVQMPPLSTLENCAISNPDGCGIATPGKVYKTLHFKTFVKYLQGISADTPAIIHFRYATHGSICRSNCHPFIDNQSGVSFAHNGMLQIDPIGNMTDSEMAFRFYFMPIINEYGLYSHELKSVVNSIIDSSKFAFLNSDGQLRTFGHFIKHDGCLYSNQSFLDYGRRYAYTTNKNTKYW